MNRLAMTAKSLQFVLFINGILLCILTMVMLIPAAVDTLKPFDVDVAVGTDVPLLYVDPVLMEQVLVNLLDNAAKFSPEGGRIGVEVGRRPRPVHLQGAGRGPWRFDPRAIRAQRPGGRHGHRPAGVPPAGRNRGGRGTMSDEAKSRILVVDDESHIRKFLRISLTAHGYAVVEAVRGADAIQRAASEGVDLVVLDLGLPDMDGQDVIRRLREWSQIPILVLSVRADEMDKVEALDAGANDYVTKP